MDATLGPGHHYFFQWLWQPGLLLFRLLRPEQAYSCSWSYCLRCRSVDFLTLSHGVVYPTHSCKIKMSMYTKKLPGDHFTLTHVAGAYAMVLRHPEDRARCGAFAQVVG